MRAATLALLLTAPLAAQQANQLGHYAWLGVAPEGSPDQLTAARERNAATGSSLFRVYLGARYDYRRPFLSPQRFSDEIDGPLTPAKILSIPRYRALLDDSAIRTLVLTVYSALDYGGGPDDINLLRPFGEREQRAVSSQIEELCRLLYDELSDSDKTVILVNHEADEKLMEMLNYHGDAARAIDDLSRWSNARFDALDRIRAEHPDTRLKLYSAFEISTVNLAIRNTGRRFSKSARAGGHSALRQVVPRIRTDLISYSAYESVNSPYRTQDLDTPPAEIARRLRRDLDLIADAAGPSISATGRRRFGEKFVMIGELGFARDRTDELPSGGVLPRLFHALRTGFDWGCPYVVLWQMFDAPRQGDEAWGFGSYARDGVAPVLRAPANACNSVATCLEVVLPEGLDSWQESAGY